MSGNLNGVNNSDQPTVKMAGHTSAEVASVGETASKFTEMFLMKDTEGGKPTSSQLGYVRLLHQEIWIK